MNLAVDTRGFAAIDGLVDTPQAGPWDGINDGLHGGLGGFGVHVRLPDGQHRHLDSVHWEWAPGREQCGVRSVWSTGTLSRSSVLVWGGRRMFEVTHHWWSDGRPIVDVTVKVLEGTEGCSFKEPKISANGFRFSPGVVRELDSAGRTLRRHVVWKIRNPKASTKQLVHPDRRSISLGYHGKVKVWCDDLGFRQWRKDVEHLEAPEKEGKAYCHCNPLRPSWELVRWPQRCGLLICAWTGGVGQHDCWCAGRPAIVGASYRVRIGITRAA